MASIMYSSIVLLVALFLSVPDTSNANVIPDPSTVALINNVCSQTSDSTFCRDVYNAHLYTPHEDPKGLCQIALAQTVDYATATRVYIGNAENNEKDRAMKALYEVCRIGYQEILGVYTDANLAFGGGDYRKVIFDVQRCPRFVLKCQSVLGNRVPQLSIQNGQNKVLIEMSLASANLIGKF